MSTSTRTRSRTKRGVDGQDARGTDPARPVRAAGDERSEPGGRAQRGAGGACAPSAGVPASVGAWAREHDRRVDVTDAALARDLPEELVDEALALARLRRDLGGGELAAAVRERLSDELIDELLQGARGEEEIVGPGGLLADLTRRPVERAMAGELTEHVGYEPHAEPPGGTG